MSYINALLEWGGRRPKVFLCIDRRQPVAKLNDEKNAIDQICQMMAIFKPRLHKYVEAEREVTLKA